MSNIQEVWPAGATATMNVTYTQSGAGAQSFDIVPGAGNEFIVMGGRGIYTGTNGLNLGLFTAAGGSEIILVADIGSGVNTRVDFGIGLVGTSVTASNADVGLGYPFIVSGTQAFSLGATGAGSGTDTFQILMNIRVRGTLPTVSNTGAGTWAVSAGSASFQVR